MEILERLDPEIIISDPDIRQKYAKDWSEVPACVPSVVLLPRNSQEISDILSLCQEFGQPIVTQGGRTGLAGGATPRLGEWVLSLERMHDVIKLDIVQQTLHVQAGAILETIQKISDEAGFVFPIDLGARGSCTVGGIAATNAGGTQVIHYGMTRACVLGLTVVLPSGKILPIENTLIKNNAGFDLKHLFVGSEGTLGVISEVIFKLFPQRASRHTALCALPNFAAALQFMNFTQRNFLAVTGFEIMWDNYFQASLSATHNKQVFSDDHPFYVLLEVDGVREEDGFDEILMGAFEQGILADVVIAKNNAERDRLWGLRDGISEIMPLYPVRVDFDVGIPNAKMETFVQSVEKELENKYEDSLIFVFGHMGDGNLHLMIALNDAAQLSDIKRFVFDATRDAGGTISAEHGIGQLKRPWLSYSRNDVEIIVMQDIKKLFDPNNILNAGRVISDI